MESFRDVDDLNLLLSRFNQRDTFAFSTVYSLFFTELHAYAGRLYGNMGIAPEDVVQDVFCYLWERRKIVFDSLSKIKAFLFVVIKNKYRKDICHLNVEQRYRNVVERDVHFTTDVMECELIASLLKYVERIPDPGGEVMKLYLAGYDANEIADKMQISIRTVYNTKSRAIGILKDFFSSNKGNVG